jgi:hypothetical protein
MYRIHRIAVALLAVCLPVIASGCSWPWDQTAGQRHGEITLNIGHSPSELGTRSTVKQCAQAAVAYAAKEGAVLHIATIGSTADMQWTTVDFHLRGSRQETNPEVAGEAKRGHSAEAEQAIKSILAAPIPVDSSDQINALAQAGRVLAGTSEPRVAVICADGHTVSPELNIYRQPLDPAGARRAIAAVRAGLFPMYGVKVFWGDVGGDKIAHLPPAREAQIAHFWEYTWAGAVYAKSVSYRQTVTLAP